MEGQISSVFQCWQRLEYFLGGWAIKDWIIFADCPVTEDQHTFGEMCDVMFMSDQDNREALVIQVLENLHDLDRGSAVEVTCWLVGE